MFALPKMSNVWSIAPASMIGNNMHDIIILNTSISLISPPLTISSLDIEGQGTPEEKEGYEQMNLLEFD